jgi:hypothetical protein
VEGAYLRHDVRHRTVEALERLPVRGGGVRRLLALAEQRLRLRDRFVDDVLRARARVSQHHSHVVVVRRRGPRGLVDGRRRCCARFVRRPLHRRSGRGLGRARRCCGGTRLGRRPTIAGDRDEQLTDRAQHRSERRLDGGRPLGRVKPLTTLTPLGRAPSLLSCLWLVPSRCHRRPPLLLVPDPCGPHGTVTPQSCSWEYTVERITAVNRSGAARAVVYSGGGGASASHEPTLIAVPIPRTKGQPLMLQMQPLQPIRPRPRLDLQGR